MGRRTVRRMRGDAYCGTAVQRRGNKKDSLMTDAYMNNNVYITWKRKKKKGRIVVKDDLNSLEHNAVFSDSYTQQYRAHKTAARLMMVAVGRPSAVRVSRVGVVRCKPWSAGPRRTIKPLRSRRKESEVQITPLYWGGVLRRHRIKAPSACNDFPQNHIQRTRVRGMSTNQVSRRHHLSRRVNVAFRR